MISVALANTDHDTVAARNLMRRYAQWTGINLCFRSLVAKFNKLPYKYAAPLSAPKLRCTVH